MSNGFETKAVDNINNGSCDNRTTASVVIVVVVVLIDNRLSLACYISENEMSDKSPNSVRDSKRPVTNGNSRRQGCVVELDNYKYTIFVAGPPDEEDHLCRTLPRTGSLTIVKKTLLSSSQQNLSTDQQNISTNSVNKLPLRNVGSFDIMGSSVEGDEEMKRIHSLDLSYKLKKLVRCLRKEDAEVSMEEIIGNIQEAADLFDSFSAGSIRRTMLGEEDEFSRVDTDAVPPEVKDWLSMTFTQSPAVVGGSKKAKFRSVAQCIRAGIVVDRIYRRLMTSTTYQFPAKIMEYFKTLDDWSFDILSFNRDTEDHSLRIVTTEILQKYDLVNKFKMNNQTLDNFLNRIEAGYGKYGNPYHNQIHGADVTQTVHSIITFSGFAAWMSDLELLSVIISSAIHDFEHTGTTNNFHINTKSEMALMYNDRSVLENHHLSASFKVLRDSEFNPFTSLKDDEYRIFRNLVIDIVLATDMSIHFQQLKTMKACLSSNEEVDKTKALSLIVHCADVSHAAKDWSLHHKWTEMLIEEFFRQGDRELQLGLSISPLCDRKTTHVADSQIGFIGYIVDPSFQVMGDMLDHLLVSYARAPSMDSQAVADHLSGKNKELDKIPRPWIECMITNKQKWKERFINGWVCPLQASQTALDKQESVDKQVKRDKQGKLSKADVRVKSRLSRSQSKQSGKSEQSPTR